MIVISHRGNLEGPNSCQENSPEAIDEALAHGFECEVDLWVDSSHQLRLGHDQGEFSINLDWLIQRKDSLWIHCKNLKALETLSKDPRGLHFFWHQNDDHVLTSKSIIWSYPGQQLSPMAVAVLPELRANQDFGSLRNTHGICTDFPKKFDQELNGSTLS